MGLFDIFSSKKSSEGASKKKTERELSRLARLAADKMAQNFDRQEAIEQLAAMGTAESAAALLKRFNWSMDPSITDHEEKEAAARGVVNAGSAALEPLRVYAGNAESLTWPIKVLRQIVPAEDLVDELLGVLDEFDTEYVRNIEPKRQLLITLEELPSPEVREAIEPFLTDMSEPVRYAAVTTTFACKDPASIAPLVEALTEEESLRIRNRIALGLTEAGWVIPAEFHAAVAESLPPEFVLDGDRVQRRSLP
ncbi:MAG: HEAT repeat domain-containing protein [Polyangiaceae bacterium]|nr:HEAT repeat domain-containing protein [Polyangiaceae bacterium]